MKNRKNFLPGIFTALNIFCGFLAIIKISEGKFITGCWLIVLAGIFDTLDGRLARLIKSASNFGVEFDSLADVISFGLAPSILLYYIYFKNFNELGLIVSFSPLIVGAVRLARFNIQLSGFEKTNFSGLPIPIAAMSIVSFVIFNYYFWNEIHLTRVLIPQIVVICLLMISTIEYETLPKMTFKAGRKNSSQFILLLVGFIILILFPQETFYPLCVSFILWGVVRSLYRLLKQEKTDDAKVLKKTVKT